MTPGFEVLGLDVGRSVRFVESLGWVLGGFVSEAGMSICGVDLVMSGVIRRATWDNETSDLLSSFSSSELTVLTVSFRLFELCKDSPATLLSVASVSVRKLPSSSLSMASRYSLRFRVSILDSTPSSVCMVREKRFDGYPCCAGGTLESGAEFRVLRPSPR